MSCSGIRIGEAQALLWEDVNLDAAQLYIHRNQTRSGRVDEPKTKDGTRTVDLPQVAVQTLRDLRSRATLPMARVFFPDLKTAN